MTEEQRQIRAAKAAEAAKKRSEKVEKEQLREIASVRRHISPEDQRIFDYIRKEIPHRSPADVAYLRDTRTIHFRKYRTHLKPKEAQSS